MKKLFTIISCIVILTYSANATVRTVSNHPAGGAQHSNLQSAYNASLNGDTLLIEGTDIGYSLTSCNWAKSLTVIGIGFNPTKQIPKRTKIQNSSCYSYFLMNNAGSGSRFYGIEFLSVLETDGFALNNLVFENCKFNGNVSLSGPATNLIFRNCIFDGNNQINLEVGYYSGTSSGTVSNCVFDGQIFGNNNVLANLTIDHCVFLGTTVNAFSQLHYALIKNNVFMNTFPGGTFNSIYTNNLCRVSGAFPPNPANGNTGSGNIENTDPLFVNVPVSTLYATTHNYNLQAGSPAINTAYDGTDIGVHGGYTDFSESGEVLINPIVREVSIVNTSVVPNGTLNVLIHATKPDND